MNKKEIVERYPVHDTLVGNYYIDYVFDADPTAPADEFVDALIEDGIISFEMMDGSFPFIVYDEGASHYRFYYILYSFNRVHGYYTPDFENYQLVCYSETDGDYLVDPECETQFDIITPDELDGELHNWNWEEISSNEVMREHAARVYDEELYNSGYVFTSAEELKNFLKINIKVD